MKGTKRQKVHGTETGIRIRGGGVSFSPNCDLCMYYALLPRTTRLTAVKYLSYSIVQYSTGWYILVYCNITEQNRTEQNMM